VAPEVAYDNCEQPECVRMLRWAESFLFAGSSALLLLIAGLIPGYRFLSAFALVPFLFRISRAGTREAVRLGLLLGGSYFAVLLTAEFTTSFWVAFTKLAVGTALFAVFGGIFGTLRQRRICTPIVVAGLWVILELGLIKAGVVPGILGQVSPGAGLIYKAAALFGFLGISFFIVLFNSIVLVGLEHLVALAKARGMALQGSERKWDLHPTPGLAALSAYLSPCWRAPPALHPSF